MNILVSGLLLIPAHPESLIPSDQEQHHGQLGVSQAVGRLWPPLALVDSLRPAHQKPRSHCVKSYFCISTFHLMYTRLCALPASISVGKYIGNSSSGPTGSLATMVSTSPDTLFRPPHAEHDSQTLWSHRSFLLILPAVGYALFNLFSLLLALLFSILRSEIHSCGIGLVSSTFSSRI